MKVIYVITCGYHQRAIIAWLQEKSQHVVLKEGTVGSVIARNKRQKQERHVNILYLQYFHELNKKPDMSLSFFYYCYFFFLQNPTLTHLAEGSVGQKTIDRCCPNC